MTEDNVLDIKQGRHPLLHLLVSQQVPNDCALGREGARDDAAAEGEAGETGPPPPERLLLLTGPNASGKTVYLRTMALITYLAHVGSFVPAEAATILTLILTLTLGLTLALTLALTLTLTLALPLTRQRPSDAPTLSTRACSRARVPRSTLRPS